MTILTCSPSLHQRQLIVIFIFIKVNYKVSRYEFLHENQKLIYQKLEKSTNPVYHR